MTPPRSKPLAKTSPFTSYAAICVGLCAFLSYVPREIRGFYVENQEHIIEKNISTDACKTRSGPPPRAPSVAYRIQSEIPQYSGLCRCHTFPYASKILELPLIRTNLALSSRLHRRTTSTRLGTEYHFQHSRYRQYHDQPMHDLARL